MSNYYEIKIFISIFAQTGKYLFFYVKKKNINIDI